MSSTPKIVRRNGGGCVCRVGRRILANRDEYTGGLCPKKNCYVAKCLKCTGSIFSFGPVWCRCEPGKPRWLKYEGMAQHGRYNFETDKFEPFRVAIKPNIAKRRRGRG